VKCSFTHFDENCTILAGNINLTYLFIQSGPENIARALSLNTYSAWRYISAQGV